MKARGVKFIVHEQDEIVADTVEVKNLNCRLTNKQERPQRMNPRAGGSTKTNEQEREGSGRNRDGN